MSDSAANAINDHPRPSGRPAVSFWWEHLLFMHWCVSADAVRAMQPRIPESLSIDVHAGPNGQHGAWIGLVPFTMTNIRVAGVPGVPRLWRVPPWHAFHECNVRTYVTWTDPRTGERVPGVWFFSLDAASRVAVWMARRLWGLNYLYSRITLERAGDRVRYAVNRIDRPCASHHCVWDVGCEQPLSRPDSLEWFLTERYALFTGGVDGRPLRIGRIWHPRWRLRAATVQELEDGLVAAAFNGSEMREAISGAPMHVMHSDLMRAEAWWAQRVQET